MRAAIRTALTPAALATSSKSKHHTFQLNYCDRYGMNTGLPFTEAADTLDYNTMVYNHNLGISDYSCLCAVWPRTALNSEYNIKILAEPAVHESAAKDILDGEYSAFL